MSIIATLWPLLWKTSFLILPWLGQNSFLAVLTVTCLFWQTGESLKTQTFRFLTVWDWSVQFYPKAQDFLNSPLYAEKPKPDKSQWKTARFQVRYMLLNLYFWNDKYILHNSVILQMHLHWKHWCKVLTDKNTCTPQTHLGVKNAICTHLSYKSLFYSYCA